MTPTGEVIRSRLSAFAARWSVCEGGERAEAQTFLKGPRSPRARGKRVGLVRTNSISRNRARGVSLEYNAIAAGEIEYHPFD